MNFTGFIQQGLPIDDDCKVDEIKNITKAFKNTRISLNHIDNDDISIICSLMRDPKSNISTGTNLRTIKETPGIWLFGGGWKRYQHKSQI